MESPTADHSSPAPNPAVDVGIVELGVARLIEAFEAALEEIGSAVPPAQLRAVLIIDRLGRPSLGQLAAILGASASATSRLCDRMQTSGLLERIGGGDDRRGVSLKLTEAGGQLAGWVREQRRATLRRLLAGMSPTGRSALEEGLRELRTTTDG